MNFLACTILIAVTFIVGAFAIAGAATAVPLSPWAGHTKGLFQLDVGLSAPPSGRAAD
jgi:hypothetical protein